MQDERALIRKAEDKIGRKLQNTLTCFGNRRKNSQGEEKNNREEDMKIIKLKEANILL